MRYRAVDVDGNVGLAKSCVVRIQRQVPAARAGRPAFGPAGCAGVESPLVP